MRAVVVNTVGMSAKALTVSTVPIPIPKPGELLVKNVKTGVNFIDVYHRSGLYNREIPFILGVEAAGIVQDVGAGVSKDMIGKRVGYHGLQTYCEYTAVSYDNTFDIPDGITFDDAVACITQGLTAHYLTNSTYQLKPDDWCLVHAAAGGTGRLIVQIAKILGAKVIGTSSSKKLQIGYDAGADYMIDYILKSIPNEVMKITDSKGVHVCYDGVGASTWEQSLDSLRKRGTCVYFGNASGPVPKINPLMLTNKGSLYITRPKLGDYIANRIELQDRVKDLFTWLQNGKLKVSICKEFPLDRIGEAHEYIQEGKTTGKIIVSI